MTIGQPKDSMQMTLDVLNFASTALPGILKIINMLKDADPNMTIGDFQMQAGDAFAENLAEIEQWHKDHPGA
jgi:hypothetical protein